MISSFLKSGALALIVAFTSNAAPALEISGAGASFPYPLFAKWAEAYKEKTGKIINYQSLGSGAGIRQIKARTIVFGASDQPLNPEELDAAALTQWPQVVGGVVPVVNLEGINPGDLVLNGPTLARIFLGEIKSWDDWAIKSLNPQMKLPPTPIIVVHRSDASGSTFTFTNYLSKHSAKWKSRIGESVAIDWPLGMAAKGNEGVAHYVAGTRGAVGYIEYAYAKQNKLTYTSLLNKDGKVVAPAVSAFQAAVESAEWAQAPGFLQILTDQPGAQSWPITATAFILMPRQPPDPVAAAEALRFFDWAFAQGGKTADELGYVSMPAPLVALIKKSWTTNIRDATGKPLLN